MSTRTPQPEPGKSSLFADAIQYEISIVVGPCRESEAETLTLELAEYLRDRVGEMGSPLGAALAVGPWREDQ